MTSKSRKRLLLLTEFSTFCLFDAGFPHLCAVKARKRAAALAYILVQQLPVFVLSGSACGLFFWRIIRFNTQHPIADPHMGLNQMQRMCA